MITLDTNILTRLLLQDDAVQCKKVKALFRTDQIFTASLTVILELVWILESTDISAEPIGAGLKALINHTNFN